MNSSWKYLAGAVMLCLMAGCTKNMDLGGALDAGANAMKAATLTDGDMQQMANQSCEYSDSQSKIAPANSKYVQRLNAIAKKLDVAEVNGAKTNYKVYLTNDVNAWAMANGCIRVYSGLMDMMNDDEVMGVVGHEIGHVALGHSRKRYQVAFAAAAARGAAASAGGSIGALSKSELGDLTESLVKAQYSQSNESESDDYSFDLLVKRNLSPKGLITGFQKLAQLDGGNSSMFSSHPSSSDRASRLEARMKAELGTESSAQVKADEKKAAADSKKAPAKKPAAKKPAAKK